MNTLSSPTTSWVETPTMASTERLDQQADFEVASKVLRTWISGEQVYAWDIETRTPTWTPRY